MVIVVGRYQSRGGTDQIDARWTRPRGNSTVPAATTADSRELRVMPHHPPPRSDLPCHQVIYLVPRLYRDALSCTNAHFDSASYSQTLVVLSRLFDAQDRVQTTLFSSRLLSTNTVTFGSGPITTTTTTTICWVRWVVKARSTSF